ncbi:MAG: riboflavin synthase, partial [Limisphaerales bacterium]
MFTGIVEETGTVEKIERGKNSIALAVGAKNSARGLKIGGSVAVNGCCLTATKISSRGKFKWIRFDLLNETWTRTNFQFLKT